MTELPRPPRPVPSQSSRASPAAAPTAPQRRLYGAPTVGPTDRPRRAGEGAMPGRLPISAHLGGHLDAPSLSPPRPCTPCLPPAYRYPCLSFPLFLPFALGPVTLLLYGRRGRQIGSELPSQAWGCALGPASPHPHGDSDGLCPFRCAGCQVLGPDSQIPKSGGHFR